jgi:hypothetical protein
MVLTFTADDRSILEQHQLERLQSYFVDTLPLCLLHLSSRHLAIHCAEPWMVDQLLYQMDKLRWQVRVILGIKHLSIYYAQEEIYKTVTTPPTKKRKVINRI